MNKFTIYKRQFADLRRILRVALLLLGAAGATAAPLRVTTWDLEPNMAAGTNGTSASYQKNLMGEAAEVLAKLHPDVIILQGVPDWQSCSELVKALKPVKYNVAAWSSYRDARTGRLSGQQTAILSKTRAYISWTEGWKNDGAAAAPGGFAFAAIKKDGHSVGFFSVQLGGNALLGEDGRDAAQQAAREESARQLLAQVDSLKNWTTNRIQALVAAGDFNTSADEPALAGEKTLAALERVGLMNAFGAQPLGKRITLPGSSSHSDATVDYIFARDAKPVASPEIVPAALTEHYPVTCDLDVETAPLPPQVAQTTPTESATSRADTMSNKEAANFPSVTQMKTTIAVGKNDWWIAGIAAGAVLLLVLLWKSVLGRRVEQRPVVSVMTERQELVRTTPERIVIAPQTADTTGSAADHPPIVHIEAPSAGETRLWQRRAEEAEQRAHRARAVVQQGLLAHLSEWLKGKIVQRLSLDRAQLLEVQRKATAKMLVVDERLAKIEGQLQEHNRVYEKRIEELEKELTEAREENRELIRAKIAQVKADMEKERAEAARRAKEQS